jgi:hypothetical protein
MHSTFHTSWHNSASTQVYGSANANSNKIFNAVANLVSNKLEMFFFYTNKTMHYKLQIRLHLPPSSNSHILTGNTIAKFN